MSTAEDVDAVSANSDCTQGNFDLRAGTSGYVGKMTEFEAPAPLTKWNAALADWYDRRYPGIEISEPRKAWRGQHEIDRGRAAVESVIEDLSRPGRVFKLTIADATGFRSVREFYA